MIAYASLMLQRFGPEWETLPAADKANVLADFSGLCRDEYDVDDATTAGEVAVENAFDASREYRRRIGGGNLAAYAACLAVKSRA